MTEQEILAMTEQEILDAARQYRADHPEGKLIHCDDKGRIYFHPHNDAEIVYLPKKP